MAGVLLFPEVGQRRRGRTGYKEESRTCYRREWRRLQEGELNRLLEGEKSRLQIVAEVGKKRTCGKKEGRVGYMETKKIYVTKKRAEHVT